MFDAEVMLKYVKSCQKSLSSHEKTPLESHKTIISHGFSQHLPILSRHISTSSAAPPAPKTAPKNGVVRGMAMRPWATGWADPSIGTTTSSPFSTKTLGIHRLAIQIGMSIFIVLKIQFFWKSSSFFRGLGQPLTRLYPHYMGMGQYLFSYHF